MTNPTVSDDGINTAFSWDDELEGLYASWRRRVDAGERVHASVAARLSRRKTALTAVALVATALAGAALLAPVVASEAYARATAVIGTDALSVAGACLAGLAMLAIVLETAFRDGARAEDHRIAALRYASLGRVMTVTAAMPREARGAPDDALTYVRDRVDRYARESPRVRVRRRRKIEAAVDRSSGRLGDVAPNDPATPVGTLAST